MFSAKLLKLIKKVVAFITAFCGGAAAVFLISGTGDALMRVLVFVIFFVSAINLGLYANEILAEKRKKATAGGQGKPGGGGSQGGGGQGGGGQGGGGGPGGRPGGGPR